MSRDDAIDRDDGKGHADEAKENRLHEQVEKTLKRLVAQAGRGIKLIVAMMHLVQPPQQADAV